MKQAARLDRHLYLLFVFVLPALHCIALIFHVFLRVSVWVMVVFSVDAAWNGYISMFLDE
jgi:hypothetical protein